MSVWPPTPDYGYRSAGESSANRLLLRDVKRLLAGHAPRHARIVDLGCGNGAFAQALNLAGYQVLGIDASESGIRVAREEYPSCRFAVGSVYDDLAGQYGRFSAVVSLEVVEHLYSPRRYAATVWDLLEPGGLGVISTPYHGYWKNLALALTNRFDAHFSPLWEGGHIKFWSERTLGELLRRQGFEQPRFRRAGRIGPIAKSMIAAFRRPSGSLPDGPKGAGGTAGASGRSDA